MGRSAKCCSRKAGPSQQVLHSRSFATRAGARCAQDDSRAAPLRNERKVRMHPLSLLLLQVPSEPVILSAAGAKDLLICQHAAATAAPDAAAHPAIPSPGC